MKGCHVCSEMKQVSKLSVLHLAGTLRIMFAVQHETAEKYISKVEKNLQLRKLQFYVL